MQADKGGQVQVERLARTLAAFDLRIDLDRLLVRMHAACRWECMPPAGGNARRLPVGMHALCSAAHLFPHCQPRAPLPSCPPCDTPSIHPPAQQPPTLPLTG